MASSSRGLSADEVKAGVRIGKWIVSKRGNAVPYIPSEVVNLAKEKGWRNGWELYIVPRVNVHGKLSLMLEAYAPKEKK